MSRKVYRVPLDFAWQLNEIWRGFLNPHPYAPDCASCAGTGYSPAAKRYSDEWYGKSPFDPRSMGSVPFAANHPRIVAFARQQIERNPSFYLAFTHSSTPEQAIRREAERLAQHVNACWLHHLSQADVDVLFKEGRFRDWPICPTAAEVNVALLFGWGHNCINQWICVKARCQREGEPSQCDRCKGKGHVWTSPEAERMYESWEKEEPPTGDGWQMWETVSEGSPISPVFRTPAELARWLTENANEVDEGTTYEQWLAMIGKGWCPSAMSLPGHGYVNGVQAVTILERNEL